MDDVSSPYISPTPPPPSQKTNLPMLYYGLAIIGTAAIVLAIYNLIIIKWCSNRRQDLEGQSQGRAASFLEATRTAGQSMELSSFKYKKDNSNNSISGQDQGSDYECAVCLSVLEEGEEVRKLPGCNHSFHASCIDMWLYSHSDCPLCRARVEPPPSFCRRQPVAAETPDNSRENLLGANAHFIPLV